MDSSISNLKKRLANIHDSHLDFYKKFNPDDSKLSRSNDAGRILCHITVPKITGRYGFFTHCLGP